MTLEEKLRAMEALWADLTRKDDQFESPAWHKDVLKERDERLKTGMENVFSWRLTAGRGSVTVRTNP